MQHSGITQTSQSITPLWRPTLTSNITQEDYTASDLREGSVITVSGGCYKENWGTSALIIEGPEYSKHRIASTWTFPIHAKDQDAYRSELAGIFHVVSIVEQISIKFNILEGTTTIAYDDLNVKENHGQRNKILTPLKQLWAHISNKPQNNKTTINILLATRKIPPGK